MSYAAVDTIMQGTRAGGDIRGQVSISLLKQAATRVAVIGNTDKLESSICRAIIEGSAPVAWTTMVLEVLDLNGKLVSHTDAEVDTAVLTAWDYFKASRQLT